MKTQNDKLVKENLELRKNYKVDLLIDTTHRNLIFYY